MNRDENFHKIPLYLTGQMNPVERADFEEELELDAGLRAETTQMRALWDGLALLPLEQPSATLRARFYQSLNNQNRNARSPAALTRSVWLLRPWQGFGLAALIFAVGLAAGRSSFSNSSAATQSAMDQVTQLREEIRAMRQMVALSLLDRQSANARLEGVSMGSRLEKPDREVSTALLAAINHDPNVNVRLSAVDAAQKFAADASVRQALIDSIGLQESPLVQIALIDALVQMRAAEAASELGKIARDSQCNANVRQRASWGVQKLGLP